MLNNGLGIWPVKLLKLKSLQQLEKKNNNKKYRIKKINKQKET